MKYLSSAIVILSTISSCNQVDGQVQSMSKKFKNEEVIIEQKIENFTLAGTLSIPNKSGPHPAILMLTGSGGHTRDQVISGLPMFQKIGDYLAEQGIAVLRVDDRGEGASTGPKVRESTTEQRATDAMAAFKYLESRKEIDNKQIGLLGHSEGTYTAAMIASKSPNIAFIVMLSPFAMMGSDLWVWQQGNILRMEGEFSEEKIRSIEKELLNMVEHIGRGGNTDEGFYKFGGAACLAWGDPPNDITDEFISEAFGDLRQPWYEYFFATNPSKYLVNIKQPILALFGSEDQQTPPLLNVESLSNSLLKAENKSFTIQVLPLEDHFFMTGDGLAPNEHVHNKMKMSSAMLEAMKSWLLQNVK